MCMQTCPPSLPPSPCLILSLSLSHSLYIALSLFFFLSNSTLSFLLCIFFVSSVWHFFPLARHITTCWLDSECAMNGMDASFCGSCL